MSTSAAPQYRPRRRGIRQLAYRSRSQITLGAAGSGPLEWQLEGSVENLGTIPMDCDEIAERLSRDFTASGLRVTRSFDLLSARQAMRNPEGCPCPHHGTSSCSCQYIVLLVENAAGGRLTLVAHGHDGATHLSMDQLSLDPTVRAVVQQLIVGLRTAAPG